MKARLYLGAIALTVMATTLSSPALAQQQKKSCSSLAQSCAQICKDPRRNCGSGECSGYKSNCMASKSNGTCTWESANNKTPGVLCQ